MIGATGIGVVVVVDEVVVGVGAGRIEVVECVVVEERAELLLIGAHRATLLVS